MTNEFETKLLRVYKAKHDYNNGHSIDLIISACPEEPLHRCTVPDIKYCIIYRFDELLNLII